MFDQDEELKKLKTKSATITIYMEAKQLYDGRPQNLLTLEHFREMIAFDVWLYNLTIPAPPLNRTNAEGEPPTLTTFY